MKKSYTATAPDGTELTINSKRPFTHAVFYTGPNTNGIWENAGFSGSAILAEKVANTYRGYAKNPTYKGAKVGAATVVVVEVREN